MKFIDTKHVLLRLQQRGISSEDVRAVVKYGTSQIALHRGKHGGMVKKFRKTNGKRTLVVVAEVKKNEFWLITAYCDES